MQRLSIPGDVMAGIIDHCRSGFPNESCGICGGRDGVVEEFHAMENVDHSPVSYFMDPKAQFRVMKALRAAGRQMVAIYHSHPHSAPYPSPKDVRLASYPDTVYLIVSLADSDSPRAKAYIIADGSVDEVGLEITD
jgi:proteasome lid subunit RPN8/RPN11